MKNKIIYHNRDLDGFCSGAITKKHLIEQGERDIEMVGWNYGDESPIKEDVKSCNYYIVDLSLESRDMVDLFYNANKVVWIDHHKSAIELSKKEGYSDMTGVRWIGDSAAKLAWDYFYPDFRMPLSVYYVDRYDVWKKEKDWEKVMDAQIGMRFHMKNPEDDKAFENWVALIAQDSMMNSIFEDGILLNEYQKGVYEIAARSAFDLMFEGIKFCAINCAGGSNTVQSVIREDHEAIMTFVLTRKGWTVGMYGNGKNIDLSVIATKFGGGGHADACGFVIDDIYKIIEK